MLPPMLSQVLAALSSTFNGTYTPGIPQYIVYCNRHTAVHEKPSNLKAIHFGRVTKTYVHAERRREIRDTLMRPQTIAAAIRYTVISRR